MVANKEFCNYILNESCLGLVFEENNNRQCSFGIKHITSEHFERMKSYALSKGFKLSIEMLNDFLFQIQRLSYLVYPCIIEGEYYDNDFLIGEVLRLYNNVGYVDLIKVHNQEYLYDGTIKYSKPYIVVNSGNSFKNGGELYSDDGLFIMDIERIAILRPTLYHRRIDSFYGLSSASVSQNHSLWTLIDKIHELLLKKIVTFKDTGSIICEARKYGINSLTLLFLLRFNVYGR